MEKFTGKVWVLDDDIDTDIIIPTEYLALKTIDDMKQYGIQSSASGTGRTDSERRHYCCRKELWMWFFQRTGTGNYQSTGNSVCNCQIFCENFLQKFY